MNSSYEEWNYGVREANGYYLQNKLYLKHNYINN